MFELSEVELLNDPKKTDKQLELLNDPEKTDKSCLHRSKFIWWRDHAMAAYLWGENSDCFSHIHQCFITCTLLGTSKQNSSEMKRVSFTVRWGSGKAPSQVAALHVRQLHRTKGKQHVTSAQFSRTARTTWAEARETRNSANQHPKRHTTGFSRLVDVQPTAAVVAG